MSLYLCFCSNWRDFSVFKGSFKFASFNFLANIGISRVRIKARLVVILLRCMFLVKVFSLKVFF